MSNSEAPISFTTKINGDLFTIRGDDPGQFFSRLEAFNMFPQVKTFIDTFNGDTTVPAAVANAFPDAQVVNTATGAPTCSHGPRIHRKGTGAKGPWQAWFCPTPKGTPDQCKPMFI